VLAKYKKDYDALSRMANTQNEQYQEIQKQYEILARQHSQLETDAIKIISSGMAISEKSQESSQPDNDNTSIKTQPSARKSQSVEKCKTSIEINFFLIEKYINNLNYTSLIFIIRELLFLFVCTLSTSIVTKFKNIGECLICFDQFKLIFTYNYLYLPEPD
jgi:hypothetical protein